MPVVTIAGFNPGTLRDTGRCQLVPGKLNADITVFFGTRIPMQSRQLKSAHTGSFDFSIGDMAGAPLPIPIAVSLLH